MGSRGFWGFLILLIAAALWSFFKGPAKITQMENEIQTNLNNAGYSSFAKVNMAGNIATLTGTAPSEAAVSDAVNVAKNTTCKSCLMKEKIWHEVNNKLEFVALPTQSPFTFSGLKDSDGRVTLTGFVGSEAAKQNVIAKAQSLFGSNLAGTSIGVANGAPNDVWNQVVQMDMVQLASLTRGRFVMEDLSNFISGEAASTSVREQINKSGANMPGGFDFAANISVEGADAINVGEVKSESLCQSLINDLKTGKNINFETSRADIKGAESFDLLNKLASAANQCSAFAISVEGHTDNVGDDASNQILSERRANAVVVYLRDNNVDSSRLSARGFGEIMPIAPNETAQGRALNRRIEFTVTQSQ